MKRRRQKMAEYNRFLCCLCDMQEAIEPSDFKKHREEAHQFIEHRGRRRSKLHLDARDWFEWHYEWLNPEPDDTVFALQMVRQPRRHSDKAMWS